MATPQQERAALLTTLAQPVSPAPAFGDLGIFAGPWEWASANYDAMAATAPVKRRASGRRVKNQHRGRKAACVAEEASA